MLRQAVGSHIVWISEDSADPRAAEACREAIAGSPECPDIVVPSSYSVLISRTSPNLGFSVSGGCGGGLPIPLDAVAFRNGLLLGDEEDLATAPPAADEESSFDDFDDEFDDDFEEEENDPDWDHPDDSAPEAPPPGKGGGRKK